MQKIKVFIGADRSQWIGVKVLEHSLQRHSKAEVEVHPMIDLPVRPPKNPAHDQRTGFSFSRFAIPALAGYQGRAIYMDADMLVFRDIAELWNLPMGEQKVLVQEDLTAVQGDTSHKRGAPHVRIRQCSVMLLDCERLDWKVEAIVQGFDDGKYDYAQLMYQLCLLPDEAIGARIPFQWNSLEHFDEKTGNIHYTDMGTQPWVWSGNRHGHLWVEELRLAIADGTLSQEIVDNEVALGYARPSLRLELSGGSRHLPLAIRHPLYWAYDRLHGFRPHQRAHRDREQHLQRLRSEAGYALA